MGSQTTWPPTRQGERGAVAVLVVGIFTTLLLFVGFSVDYGILLRYRRAMQNACDAGALAGGLNLKGDVSSVVPNATGYASKDMTQNAISWDNLTTSTLDSNWQPDSTDPDRVRVTVHATVPMFFYSLVRASVGVAVGCTAKVAPVIVTAGLAPLGLNYDAWTQYWQQNAGCWQYVLEPVNTPAPPACSQPFILTVTDISQGSWGLGNAGFICLNGSTTTCDPQQWRDEFAKGSPVRYCYDLNQTPAVGDYTRNGQPCTAVAQPGLTLADVEQGVDTRCASPAPPTSPNRILMVPLLNPSISGNSVEIWGFAALLLSCPRQGDSIQGSFVSIVTNQAVGTGSACQQGSPSPPCTGVWTIRLIE